MEFLPMVMLEIVASESARVRIVQAIIKTARTNG
ncbi:MAG: P-II family nitrogen regulator, partial [Candidatus Omnitrophica bacterium]|nr:P-II family nitrogen regulator [Candidatus Omnitrophota bacterium]